MLSFILKIVKNIVLKLATTGAFSFLQPWLLKVDAWCEEKLGIDLIVQEKKFFEKYPLIEDRIKKLEKDSHPPCPLEEFDAYPAIIERIEKLEKKNANSKK
jgi:hypothetical protein